MKHYGDITKLKGYELPIVDCITGGSPCQDLSIAGTRGGLSAERSGLFMEQIRIIKEMREHDRARKRSDEYVRPRFMVWENVPGAFSSNKGEDFRAVLEETARIADETAVIPKPDGKWSKSGCILGNNWSIAWRVHDTQFWGTMQVVDGRVLTRGTPQRRKRIALVADFRGHAAPEVLFERKSVSGYFEQSEKEGEETTRTTGASVGAAGFDGMMGARAGNIGYENEKSPSLCAGKLMHCVSYNDSNKTSEAICSSGVQGVDCYNLTTTGDVGRTMATASGGLNEHIPCVVEPKEKAICSSGEITPTLVSSAYKGPGNTQDGLAVMVTELVVIENHPNDSRVKICEDNVFQTLSGRMGTGGNNVPMGLEPKALSFQERAGKPGGGKGILIAEERTASIRTAQNQSVCYGIEPGAAQRLNTEGRISEEVSPTLRANAGDNQPGVAYGLDRASFNQGKNAKFDFSIEEEKIGAQVAKGPGAVFSSVVRRLTPLECERLQGFPDNWTNIGEWIDSKGKTRKCSDSARYKALGNSIATPFWFWLLRRISAIYPRPATLGSLFDGIGGFPYCWERCNGKGTAIWASEIEDFPIAVTKLRFPEE